VRITIAAIGRLKDGPERALYKRFADRVDGAGRAQAIGPLKLIELPESRASSSNARKHDEAGRLMEKIDIGSGNRLVSLDETGAAMTSAAFASMLGDHQEDGISELVFAIGGADGHGQAITAASSKSLSLGSMTLPHGLARIILVEQIYRAITINSGHPYHRA